jgi:hypothetical protein
LFGIGPAIDSEENRRIKKKYRKLIGFAILVQSSSLGDCCFTKQRDKLASFINTRDKLLFLMRALAKLVYF